MARIAHIISDLHLATDRPDLFLLFEHYMREIAPNSDQLFVLGDLFDVWLGDDCLQVANPSSQMYRDVVNLFKTYSSENKSLFFFHGNRDLLLGKSFEKQTGGELLEEPFITHLSKLKVAMLHGDTLCTDDTAYQEYRNQVHNKDWQSQFLSLSMQQRIEMATGIKEKSKQAQITKTSEIMDVNHDAVVDFFRANPVDCLIHGHTHRQAIHTLDVDDVSVKRVVLSDWGPKGFYLSVANNSIEENYFSL